MNNIYNEIWDRELNNLLDNYKLKDIDNYTATLNGVEIWIGNYPYAYGTVHTNGHYGRPSRSTIYRLRQRVKVDSMTLEEVRDYKLSQIL
jgi:hypothetical protein